MIRTTLSHKEFREHSGEEKAELAFVPSTRFQGSKRKLLPWLRSTFDNIAFESVTDVMSGTASVGFLLKSMGKRVRANDYLRFNYNTATAFIENSNTTLSDEDISWLLKRHRNVRYSSFVEDIFRGYYFTNAENSWLDQTATNITTLEGKTTTQTRFKRAMAMHCLAQCCLMKRPFNLFHRKNLNLRLRDVPRNFGNKTTWEKTFEELFCRMAAEARHSVFSNGENNRALNADAFRLRSKETGLVYIDPPYLCKFRGPVASHYRLLYHFIEGLSQYEQWPDLIDLSHPLKALRPNGNSIEKMFTVPRDRLCKTYLEWLNGVISKWPNAKIVLSYKQPGIPSVHALRGLLIRTGRSVSTKTLSYTYALSKSNGVPRKNIETLLIAT